MHIVTQLRPPEDFRVRIITTESAESILAALQDGITERLKAGVPNQELVTRKLAILELTRLVSMPECDERAQRVNALIEEFGAEDVARWLSRICK